MNKSESLLRQSMSSLGYGCYALSGAYGEKLKEYEMINILKCAYELGIRYYDTAVSYANTEEILGKAVKSFRHNIVISSKVGIGEGNIVDLSKGNVRCSCESSLRKLGTDYLDILMVHYHDPHTPVEDTIEALEALKKEGKIQSYGVGHLPMDKTLEYLKLSNPAVILAEFSPVNTKRYRELRLVQGDYGFDMIAFSITGRGILAGKINNDTKFAAGDIRETDPLFKRSKLHSGLRISQKLREIGSKFNKTPAQIAISWTIQSPGIISGLMGPTKMEHLYENSQVLNWSLDSESMEEINCFIEKEEEELEKSIYQEVMSILSSPLSRDFEQASNDLVYVLEYVVENRLLSYDRSIDYYMRVLGARKSNNKSIYILDEIKGELIALIQLN